VLQRVIAACIDCGAAAEVFGSEAKDKERGQAVPNGSE